MFSQLFLKLCFNTIAEIKMLAHVPDIPYSFNSFGLKWWLYTDKKLNLPIISHAAGQL